MMKLVREFVPAGATPGDNLQITIDSQVQRQLTESLQKGIKKYKAGWRELAIIEDVGNRGDNCFGESSYI